MDIREQRVKALQELLLEEGDSTTALANRLLRSPSQISQWLHGHRTITEESARTIERNAGKPPGWMDTPSGGASSPHGARAMSLRPYTLPPTVSWEAVMQSVDLPDQFVLHMPDDALAPNIAKGMGLIFDRSARPFPTAGVLLADAGGRRYVRRFAEAPGGRWLGQAINQAYATLDSERDGLAVLAVMTGRLSGTV